MSDFYDPSSPTGWPRAWTPGLDAEEFVRRIEAGDFDQYLMQIQVAVVERIRKRAATVKRPYPRPSDSRGRRPELDEP